MYVIWAFWLRAKDKKVVPGHSPIGGAKQPVGRGVLIGFFFGDTAKDRHRHRAGGSFMKPWPSETGRFSWPGGGVASSMGSQLRPGPRIGSWHFRELQPAHRRASGTCCPRLPESSGQRESNGSEDDRANLPKETRRQLQSPIVDRRPAGCVWGHRTCDSVPGRRSGVPRAAGGQKQRSDCFIH